MASTLYGTGSLFMRCEYKDDEGLSGGLEYLSFQKKIQHPISNYKYSFGLRTAKIKEKLSTRYLPTMS